MLARTDRHGSRAASWKAMPRWWLRRATEGASPCTKTSPLVGWSRSARTRRMVDLPHPDGPSRARKAPWGMARSTRSTRGDGRATQAGTLGQPGDPDAVDTRRLRPQVALWDDLASPRDMASWCSARDRGRDGLHRGVSVDLVEDAHVEQLRRGDGGAPERQGLDVGRLRRPGSRRTSRW